eukprot:1357015-Prymnesium_polylepis.1
MSPPQVPPPSAPLWPPASPPSSPDSVNAFHYTLGSLLALLSGILVAYSMGLEIKLDEQGAPPPTIRFCARWPRAHLIRTFYVPSALLCILAVHGLPTHAPAFFCVRGAPDTKIGSQG